MYTSADTFTKTEENVIRISYLTNNHCFSCLEIKKTGKFVKLGGLVHLLHLQKAGNA